MPCKAAAHDMYTGDQGGSNLCVRLQGNTTPTVNVTTAFLAQLSHIRTAATKLTATSTKGCQDKLW